VVGASCTLNISFKHTTGKIHSNSLKLTTFPVPAKADKHYNNEWGHNLMVLLTKYQESTG
jgi:hypothetical protein